MHYRNVALFLLGDSPAILGDFERKILRAIFWPTNDNREWSIKYNELYTLYKESDIVTYIKIN